MAIISTQYDIGDRPKFGVTFSTAAGVDTDPTVVKFLLRFPDGTEQVFENPDVVKDAVGIYSYALHTFTVAGEYVYRWVGTGALESAAEANLTVITSEFTTPLP